jgi:hypothetical protein
MQGVSSTALITSPACGGGGDIIGGQRQDASMYVGEGAGGGKGREERGRE